MLKCEQAAIGAAGKAVAHPAHLEGIGRFLQSLGKAIENKVTPAAMAPRDLYVSHAASSRFSPPLWHFMAMPVLAQCHFVCVFTPYHASQFHNSMVN